MNKWTPEIRAAAVKLHAQGLKQGEIGERIGLSRNSVAGLMFYIRKGSWREAKKASHRAIVQHAGPKEPETSNYTTCRKLGIVVLVDRYNGVSVSGGIALDFV